MQGGGISGENALDLALHHIGHTGSGFCSFCSPFLLLSHVSVASSHLLGVNIATEGGEHITYFHGVVLVDAVEGLKGPLKGIGIQSFSAVDEIVITPGLFAKNADYALNGVLPHWVLDGPIPDQVQSVHFFGTINLDCFHGGSSCVL